VSAYERINAPVIPAEAAEARGKKGKTIMRSNDGCKRTKIQVCFVVIDFLIVLPDDVPCLLSQMLHVFNNNCACTKKTKAPARAHFACHCAQCPKCRSEWGLAITGCEDAAFNFIMMGTP
jgi:hypothetical protein